MSPYRDLIWTQNLTMVRDAKTLIIPRQFYDKISLPLKSARLIGFCDASTKAYTAVVNMRVESESSIDVKFVCSKN